MSSDGVYVRFEGDFERDKETLRNFTKKYSRDVAVDLDYIDNELAPCELYDEEYVVVAYIDDSDCAFWFGDEDDYCDSYRDVTIECKNCNRILGEI